MKRIVAALAAFTLLLGTPTVALAARGYSGGGSYHSSSGSSFSSGSHSYSSGGSALPSTSSSSGTYHSGASSFSGGSTSRSGSTGGTYHSGYTSPSSGARYGTSYGGRSGGLGWGHIASFGGGFLLGSMFHPFGWGYGGGYGAGWGGPGYSPTWSIFGMIVDLLVTLFIIWLIVRIFRGMARRRRVVAEPVYDIPFGSRSPMFRDLDEQAVVDACCELVASRQGCSPQDVQVDLTFNRDTVTFGAEILISGRRGYPLHQQDLVDAVAGFVASRERVGSRNVDVDLQFDEGFGVHASVRIA